MPRAGRHRNRALKRKGMIAMTTPAETVPTPNQVARRMPHRRLIEAAYAHEELLETPFGAQYVAGALAPENPRRNRELYVAGIRYGRAIREYRGDVCAPRQAESIAGVGQPGKGRGNREPKLIAEANGTIAPMLKALRTVGKRSHDITHRVIVEEAGIPPGGFRALLDGLGALAEHFKQQSQK